MTFRKKKKQKSDLELNLIEQIIRAQCTPVDNRYYQNYIPLRELYSLPLERILSISESILQGKS